MYIKDNQYTISFNEKDTTKKGNNFIFDENNNSFQLTPAVNIPSPQPNSDQVEMEISFTSAAGDNEYVRLYNSLKVGDWDSGKKKPIFILISKKNPVWKGENWDKVN